MTIINAVIIKYKEMMKEGKEVGCLPFGKGLSWARLEAAKGIWRDLRIELTRRHTLEMVSLHECKRLNIERLLQDI